MFDVVLLTTGNTFAGNVPFVNLYRQTIETNKSINARIRAFYKCISD